MKRKKIQLIFLFFILMLFISFCNKNVEKNNLENDNVVSWYDDSKHQKKQVFNSENNSNDLSNGEYKRYYKDGTIKSIVPIKEGKEHGVVKNFYSNGQLNFIMEYKNGHANGTYKGYYRSGQLFSEGQYKNNLIDGEWKYYNKDGSLNKIEVYSDNQLIRKNEYNNNGINDSIIN